MVATGETVVEPEATDVIELTPLSMENDVALVVVHDRVDGEPDATEAGLAVSVQVGANEAGGGAEQVGTVMVSVSVVTVPPNANAIPVHVTLAPAVMPAASMAMPLNVELAPSVVAEVGVQNTSQADAPASVTFELATEVSAPLILKMYVPAPLRVIPAVPIDAAPGAPVQ